MSPDDHYRAAERLLEEFAAADTNELTPDEYLSLVAVAQVHATLALCQHPMVTRSAIRVEVVQ